MATSRILKTACDRTQERTFTRKQRGRGEKGFSVQALPLVGGLPSLLPIPSQYCVGFEDL